MIVEMVQDANGRAIHVGDVVDGKHGIHGEVVTLYPDTDLVQVKIGDDRHADAAGSDVTVVTSDEHSSLELGLLIHQRDEAVAHAKLAKDLADLLMPYLGEVPTSEGAVDVLTRLLTELQSYRDNTSKTVTIAVKQALNDQLLAINDVLESDADGLSIASGDINGKLFYKVEKPIVVVPIRPTVQELEQILKEPETPVEILPDGSVVSARSATPVDGTSTVRTEADVIPAAPDAPVDGTTTNESAPAVNGQPLTQ